MKFSVRNTRATLFVSSLFAALFAVTAGHTSASANADPLSTILPDTFADTIGVTKILASPIARRKNAERKISGRFSQGRFLCRCCYIGKEIQRKLSKTTVAQPLA